jgi:AcrR family transcriptional regulator
MISPARKNAVPAPKPARRRGALDQVLIDAAMDLFASYGYRGTSLARIARAAGVTKGALYWHFADKEEFFIAVVAKVLGEWGLIFEKSAHTTNAAEFRVEFERMFDTMAALNEKNPWVSRLLLIIALESHKIGPRVLISIRAGRRRRFFRATWDSRCSGICTDRNSICAVRCAARRASSCANGASRNEGGTHL